MKWYLVYLRICKPEEAVGTNHANLTTFCCIKSFLTLIHPLDHPTLGWGMIFSSLKSLIDQQSFQQRLEVSIYISYATRQHSNLLKCKADNNCTNGIFCPCSLDMILLHLNRWDRVVASSIHAGMNPTQFSCFYSSHVYNNCSSGNSQRQPHPCEKGWSLRFHLVLDSTSKTRSQAGP